MRVPTSISVLMSLFLLVACHKNLAGPSEPSWLAATVTASADEGGASSSYSGDGHFTSTPNQSRPGAPPLFLLRSEAANGDAFELSRHGTAAPAVGTYTLGPRMDDPASLQAVYSQRRGDTTYRYAAQTGELRITDSSTDRIAGTFSFRGALAGTCTGSGSRVDCTVHASPDTPQVEVSGSFSAVRR